MPDWYGGVNGAEMIILGLLLLILGLVFSINILYIVGAILIVVGAVLWILGATGRKVGGRRTTTDVCSGSAARHHKQRDAVGEIFRRPRLASVRSGS